MAADSKIEWTGKTWNPIAGCSIVSPGCSNCYAMSMAQRIQKMQANSYYHGTTQVVNGKPVWTGVIKKAPQKTLLAPLSWKKPTTIFVNSMSDLFHEDVPDEYIDEIFAVMALCPQHTFQVLTKRAARMRNYIGEINSLGPRTREIQIDIARKRIISFAYPDDELLEHEDRLFEIPFGGCEPGLPLPNVWLGVSAERQQEANERIPRLLLTPAAVRFVSLEPLLSTIDLTNISSSPWAHCALTGGLWDPKTPQSEPATYQCEKLDQVIIGGESGTRARQSPIADHLKIIRQCRSAGVAVFEKQLGRWPVMPDGTVLKLNDKKGGDMSEWPQELRVREMPQGHAISVYKETVTA